MEINNLLERLETLPSEIREAGDKANDQWLSLKQWEHDIEVIRASLYVTLKEENDKRTDSMIKALIEKDSQIVHLESERIKLEGNYRAGLAKLREKDDTFAAVRKMAALKDSELRASSGGM